MSDQNKDDLQARIDRLEQKVEALEQRLERQNHQNPVSSIADSTKEQTVDESVFRKSSWKTGDFQPGEQWLNRIGIGLLLIGIAF